MMLEKLFTGTPAAPVRPNHLTEEPWTLQEFMGAVEKLKLNKSADECGLVAEVFKHIPTNFAAKILGCPVVRFVRTRSVESYVMDPSSRVESSLYAKQMAGPIGHRREKRNEI